MTRALELWSKQLGVEVLPELGGKISRLHSRATRREWLWHNPHLSYARAEPGHSYVALHDTGGIDECFPEVHGEVYGRPWAGEPRGDELALAFAGPGYRLERKLRVGTALELDYALANTGEGELSFVWCLHALLAVEPGMQLELPDETRVVPEPTGVAWKEFVGPLERGEVSVRAADGEALRFAFDPREIPFLGLWQNFAGWAGVTGAAPYFNLGVEPSIGDADALADARARGTAGLLPPNATRAWRVTLTLDRR